MTTVLNDIDLKESRKLSALVRTLNSSGHNPATSGNYSLRSLTMPGYSLVSESGIDKSLFSEENLLLVNIENKQQHESIKAFGKKSSDETALHLAIYRSTNANCVLHSHLLEGLLFAELFPNESLIKMAGLELLKGFKGIKTHETEVLLPTFPNTQDIDGLALEVMPVLERTPNVFGLMLRHHGLYVWGETVEEAKRHLEVFEYIFKFYLYSAGFKK